MEGLKVSNRTAKIVCVVQADKSTKIRWTFQGRALEGRKEVKTYNSDKGIVTKLLVHNVTHNDRGVYSCHANNSAGDTSANQTVIIAREDGVEDTINARDVTIVTAAIVITCVTITVIVVGLTKLARMQKPPVNKEVIEEESDIAEVGDTLSAVERSIARILADYGAVDTRDISLDKILLRGDTASQQPLLPDMTYQDYHTLCEQNKCHQSSQ